MNKKIKFYLIIAGLACFALVFTVLFKTGLTTQIQATKVTPGMAVDAVSAIINVRSDYALTLSSEETGRVMKSTLELGANIQTGDQILKIDPTDLEIEAKILRADIANLEARLALNAARSTEFAKREEDLNNYERLYKSGDYPELEIIRRRREFKVFKESQELESLNEKQQLNDLNSQLERLNRRLSKTTVYAPNNGVITEIFAYPGELLNAGSPIATVFSEALVVEAKINEEDFAGIQPGLDATVRLLTYGNQLYPAKVIRVLPTADKENQQYTAFLEVDIEAGKLIPGLSGESSIIRQRIPNALIIPRRALIGDFVFKIVGDTAVLTKVETGVRGLNNVEIRNGLVAGDLIATDGINSLKDGDRVRLAK